MKKIIPLFLVIVLVLLTTAAGLLPENESKPSLTANFVYGNPEIASINQLTFGPEGILFLGDSKNATIYALDVNDSKSKSTSEDISIDGFDKKIASSLGTTPDKIEINDMAVNPVSKTAYFAISTMDGTPVLMKLQGESLENVSLNEISHSKIALKDAIDKDAKDRRERPLRVWAISDIKYHDGQVLVSGLSNKEFGSTFRSIPFPFSEKQDYASLEIYHAAHGQYETQSPIKTFDVINMDGKDYLMASYTCTPLVLFPMDELKNGEHTKGRTVAELGSGNSPLDMISYEKEGKTYFLMSNSNRPVMKIDHMDIANSKESMTQPVDEWAVAKGVDYISLPMVNILQMDNLGDDNVVYLQRTSEGDLVLRSRSTQRM
ncbi:hypothetical protein PP182_07300 [Maribacter sp. PR1]|uniref:Uncharacterized protein n=1 Tax=Maribacter cobaltidurans TaxID=1178778 RepID=A0ABU7ITL4_9FLAO|nr:MULTISPECIES: hypothetical protein [Maribacter]MDC6388482.1 hypothetical protein [Maribacter sp. PR1]MEE1975871.1 hypothetical protein [Maribacter cobaltidurans]